MIWEGNLLKRLGKRYCVIAARGEAWGKLVIPVLGVFSVSIWSLGSHPDAERKSSGITDTLPYNWVSGKS